MRLQPDCHLSTVFGIRRYLDLVEALRGNKPKSGKDLLPPGSVSKDTRMVLVNAIYFLAKWSQPFKAELTYPQPFRVSTNAKKAVPTMHQRGQFMLFSGDGVSALQMEYRGSDASMWMLLPNKTDGVDGLSSTLTASQLQTWMDNATTSTVDVSLPKFEINVPQTLQLSKVLKALGMRDAFHEKFADFTGIGAPVNPSNRLFISEVFHKAFVKVDEAGAEAAAATAVVAASGTGMPKPAPAFNADHPFLFFIIDKSSGLILFMGKVVDPSM
jgi:serpin B